MKKKNMIFLKTWTFKNGEVIHERSRAEFRQVIRVKSGGNDVGNIVIEVELGYL